MSASRVRQRTNWSNGGAFDPPVLQWATRDSPMIKSELELALEAASVPSAKRLALAYVTVGDKISATLEYGELRPTYCEVFSKELLYLSYGGPRYKPSSDFTEFPAGFPIAFVLRPAVAERMDCFFPYDTGAAYDGLFGEPWSSELKQFDRFSVARDASRIVSAFYGTNEDFVRGRVSNRVPEVTPLPFLHDFLKTDLSQTGIDQRQRTIECLTSSSLALSADTILWIGYPDNLTQDFREFYDRCSEGIETYPYFAETRENPAELVRMLGEVARKRFIHLIMASSK